MRCVLVGNYGVGNVGDEALREYFLTVFADIDWTVVSASPRGKKCTVPRMPCGIRSLFTAWWMTVIAYMRADAIVFGGGSLFTDAESANACLIWWVHTLWARVLFRPYILAFQGIGPLKSGFARFCTQSACEHAASISVRDEESLERIKNWKLKKSPVLSFDPAFKLFASDKKTQSEGEILTIIPRGNSGDGFFMALGNISLHARCKQVQIVLMQRDKAEVHMGEVLKEMMETEKIPADIVQIADVRGLLDAIGVSSLVFTQRYHGALAAFAMGKETIIVPQKKGDKLDALGTVINRGAGERESLLQLVQKGEQELRSALAGLAS
jgi:polysaccharide pyruvyl transferase WcaK-like protein